MIQYSLSITETGWRDTFRREGQVEDTVQRIPIGRLNADYETLHDIADAIAASPRCLKLETILNVILPLERGRAHIPVKAFEEAIERYQQDKAGR